MDAVLRLHCAKAPPDLQQRYANLAAREAANFHRQAEEIVRDAAADGSAETYLRFLMTSRDARLRELAHEQLQQGNAVLVFAGLPEPKADRAYVTYLGVGSFYGRQADLRVWSTGEGEAPDAHLSSLSASIMDVALAEIAAAVVVFNRLERAAREAALAAYRTTGMLPGISRTALFVADHRLAIDEATATLSIRP